tara:strand:- start:267 stop:614 length:348 start_codon:yes stop_codon:yes gene_type:complete
MNTEELKEELKAKASPKFEQLAVEARKTNTKLDALIELSNIMITLLSRLCDLKEDQQKSDDDKHDAWKNAKVMDSKVSLWVLVLANIALYLDVIKIESNGAFITGLLDMISWGVR